MRSFYSGTIFCLFIFAQLACSGSPAGNTANTDANAAETANVPQFADAKTALAEGNRLLDTTDTEKAINAFSEAVKMDPDLAEAYFQLGIAYALIEKRDAGEVEPTPTPEEGKPKKPKEKKTNSDIAFEKAVAAYKKHIAANGKDDVAYFNLGRSYNKLDEDEDAAKALRQAVKLKPEDTEYQTELGSILIKLAKYGESVGALKKALELDPSNSKAEELLEKAEAGQKRIGFTAVKKDDKKGGKKDADDDDSDDPESNGNPPKPPPANTKKPAPPANKPK